MRPVRLLVVGLTLVASLAALLGSPAAAEPARTPRRSGVVEAGRPHGFPAAPQPAAGPAAPDAPQNVNASNHPSAQNETSIAANPLNPLNLVGGANDYRCGDAGAGYYASTDGGATWTGGVIPGLIPCAGGIYDAAGDPAIATGADGTFYYAAIAFDRAGAGKNGIFVSRSTDGGLSWANAVAVVTSSSSSTFHDKEYIAVDAASGSRFQGRVYVSWTVFSGFTSPIVLSRSTDGGTTWSPAVNVSGAQSASQGSVPAVAPNGDLYVAFFSVTGGDAIWVARSTDGGVSFAPPVRVARIVELPSPLPGNSFRTNSFPSIAITPNGTIHVTWAEWVSSSADVRASRSTDGGATWSAPVRVNSTVADDQFFPWIAAAGDGTLGICFYDQHFNTTNWLDVGCNVSRDNGATWGTTRRVTSRSSNPLFDGFGGTFIGDYNGLAISTDNRGYPFWTDTRTRNADAWTLRW